MRERERERATRSRESIDNTHRERSVEVLQTIGGRVTRARNKRQAEENKILSEERNNRIKKQTIAARNVDDDDVDDDSNDDNNIYGSSPNGEVDDDIHVESAPPPQLLLNERGSNNNGDENEDDDDMDDDDDKDYDDDMDADADADEDVPLPPAPPSPQSVTYISDDCFIASDGEVGAVENEGTSIPDSLRPNMKVKTSVMDDFVKVLGNDENRKKDRMAFFSPDLFQNISHWKPKGNMPIEQWEKFCTRALGGKGKSLFTANKLFFPSHVPGHWVLFVMDTKEKRIDIYDSSARPTRSASFPLVKYDRDANVLFHFFENLATKNGYPLMVEQEWKINEKRDLSTTPQQLLNSKDCGVFVCYFASVLSTKDKSLDFTHDDIIEWNGRQKIAQSIQNNTDSALLLDIPSDTD